MALENVTVLKKWTTAAAGMDKPALQEIVKKGKGKTPIFLVLALITRCTEKMSTLKSDKMDYRFGGQFEIKNLLTGEVQHAGEAFFPGPAESFALSAYDNAKADGGHAQAIAFTITVEKDETKNSATGYKFGMDALVNKEAGDPFADLRKALPSTKAK